MEDRTAGEARLAALGMHLSATSRFGIKETPDGLRVRNTAQRGCCRTVEYASDLITCEGRAADLWRLWFFTSWQAPIAPADQITDASVIIKGYLSGRQPERLPGVSR